MGAPPLDQRGVHQMDLGEHHADKHRVDVEVIDAHAECEVVRVLNEHEAEAIPLQRIRRGQYVALPFGRRHLAVLGRDELNIGGVGMVRRTM